MSHLPILPILVPLCAAILMLLMHGLGIRGQRVIGAASVGALAAIGMLLLTTAADGNLRVYRLGDWPAPFGIVLVHDRLAAVMVALTALLASASLIAATSGVDAEGRHFHPLLQLQLAGLNGAFLTGDLFNLFVFFEILLLASYALLTHGPGAARARAGLGYVIVNLMGSALFLIALGLVYATLGTLTMADLVRVLPSIAEQDQALVRTALALLVAVFLLKAALFPIGFWLPHVYPVTSTPVAMLFVIMTKVGIYALLRLSTIGLSAAPFTSNLLTPWLAWLAIATISVGLLGMLATRSLAVVVANLVVVSSGTLLLGVADGGERAVTAALFYLMQTTIVAAGLVLLADCIARRRGALGDRIEKGPRIADHASLGAAYLVLAVAAAGIPPLSGFLAKLMLMRSLAGTATHAAAWTALLVAGLVIALVLARAASAVFWEPGRSTDAMPHPLPERAVTRAQTPALLLLILAALALVPASRPISNYARATAAQLMDRAAYFDAVIGRGARIDMERRP